MANMSYCRFENTYRDLSDCAEEMRENPYGKVSESEHNYRMELIILCKQILEDCNCVVEMPDGGVEEMFPPLDQQRETT